MGTAGPDSTIGDDGPGRDRSGDRLPGDGWPGDEWPEDPEPVAPRPVHRPRGTFIGAAMMGLQEAMFGKVKEETVVEIESSGDPPDIDLDGLDTPLDAERRLVGPPLDQIKSRGRRRRRHR